VVDGRRRLAYRMEYMVYSVYGEGACVMKGFGKNRLLCNVYIVYIEGMFRWACGW
jgi:hypothetical protein